MDPKQPQQSTNQKNDEGHQPSRTEERQRIPLENPSLPELQITGESVSQEGSIGYPTLPSSGYVPDHFLSEQMVGHGEHINLPEVVVKSEEVKAAEAMLSLSQTAVVDSKGVGGSVIVKKPPDQHPSASLGGDESESSEPHGTVPQDIPHISVAEQSQPEGSTSGSRSPIFQQDNPADPLVEEGPSEDSFDDCRLEEHRFRSRRRTEKPYVLNVGNLEELISHFDPTNTKQFHKRCPKCNMRPFAYEKLPFWCKVNWELEINGLKIPRLDYGQPVFFLNTNGAEQYFGISKKTTERGFFDKGPSTSFG